MKPCANWRWLAGGSPARSDVLSGRVLELLDQLAVAEDAVGLPDDLDLVVVPLAERRGRSDLRDVVVVERCRSSRSCCSSPVCPSYSWISWPHWMATHSRRVGRRCPCGRTCGRSAIRRPRIREADEHAAVGEPAVLAALAELQLEPEVAVGLDRVPEHAQAAAGVGPMPPESSPSSSNPPSPSWVHWASEACVPSKMCSSAAAYAFHGPPSTRYWVSTAPEPAPSCGSSVTVDGPVVARRPGEVDARLGRRPVDPHAEHVGRLDVGLRGVVRPPSTGPCGRRRR